MPTCQGLSQYEYVILEKYIYRNEYSTVWTTLAERSFGAIDVLKSIAKTIHLFCTQSSTNNAVYGGNEGCVID